MKQTGCFCVVDDAGEEQAELGEERTMLACGEKAKCQVEIPGKKMDEIEETEEGNRGCEV